MESLHLMLITMVIMMQRICMSCLILAPDTYVFVFGVICRNIKKFTVITIAIKFIILIILQAFRLHTHIYKTSTVPTNTVNGL